MQKKWLQSDAERDNTITELKLEIKFPPHSLDKHVSVQTRTEQMSQAVFFTFRHAPTCAHSGLAIGETEN